MLTVTDLFAGAGGSSTGMIQIPGVAISLAMNHWKLAVATHNENHPDTDHDCADISQVDPRRYPNTDILWASPECTAHSVARGKKRRDATPDLFDEVLPDEAAERSRATMWDVVRFTEHHRYRAIIVENVVDAANWLPFHAWLLAMDSLGYDHQVVYLNSMHAQHGGPPAPQSRDRMYVVFWRKGDRRPDIEAHTRPQAFCPEHGQITAVQAFKKPRAWGRYRAQYVWRCPRVECRNSIVEPGWLPASTAVDWSLAGQRIGDRAKPLAPKTMARILAGLQRYGRPFTAEVAGNTFERRPGVRTWPVDDVLRTLHTTPSKALLVPVESRDGKDARPVGEPLRTMTTRSETGIVITLRGQNAPKTTGDPLDTVAANGNHHALLMRNNTGGAEMITPVTEVMRTLTTKGHQSLLVPYYSHSRAVPVREPMPTVTTVDRVAHVVTAVDVDDCLFRMLEPHEIAAGMAFPADYVMLGNRRERVRLAGNAVTPPAARDLIAAVAEALSGAA